MYFAMSSICCRPRISIDFVSNALIDSETSCRLSARFVAVTITSSRPVTVGGAPVLLRACRARRHREHRRDGGRKRLRAGPRSVTSRVSHVLPSAVFRILATGRRPGNPPPVMRRIAATYQLRNCCVNSSIDGDNGPGS